MRRRIFLLSVAVLSCIHFLPAQNPYIQHYTTFDGLPSNIIYNIFQDSQKFIWFATDAGAVRYDGSKFTTFTKKEGLNTGKITRIKEDSFGRVWITNWDGSLNYFFQNKIFNSNNAPFLDSLKPNEPFHDFFEDDDKTIYFYNAMYEISSLDKNNHVRKFDKVREHFLENLHYPNGSKVTGPFNRTIFKSRAELYIFNLYKIRKNVKGEYLLWSALGVIKVKKPFENPVLTDSSDDAFIRASCSRNGYFYILLADKMIFRYKDEIRTDTIKTPFSIWYTMSRPNSLLTDNAGQIWIGTFDEGVCCMAGDHVIQHFDINRVNTIIQDHENNIWISTSVDGVYKINPYMNIHRHYGNTLFQDKGITEMAPDPNGGLWMTNGKTLYHLAKNSFSSLEFHRPYFLCDIIYHLKSNKLIIGEKYWYFYLYNGVEINPVKKKIILTGETKSKLYFSGISINSKEDKLNSFNYFNFDLLDPDTLFGTYKNDYFQKDYNVGSRIYYTYYDNNDDLIINAKKNYILKNDTFLYYQPLAFLDNKIITQHLRLNGSTELFNVENEGIYLFHNKKFFGLTSTTGNSSYPGIRNVSYDDPVLYLASSGNIYTCNNPFDVIKNKPANIHLVDINFRNIHKILALDDSIYIASDDGLTVIPEAMLSKIKTHTPIPYFQFIMVNDTETDLSQKEITLTGNNKIKFGFGSINYSATPVIYSYMLEGLDHDWTTGRGTNVVYQNLSRGNYNFKVRTRKASTEWSIPIEFKITIKAHFWQHPVFFVFLSLLFTGLIALIIIRRKNIQIKRRELDNQLITLEQKALQSMMNPHFIFNSLGSIQTYLLEKKSNEAGLYLSQFARLIRQNLNAINAASINLEEEIDRLKNYLDLERLRMENKFDYNIEMDENLEEVDVQIPSMIIQPFVENAIWHGIAALEDKGQINIKFQMQDEKSMTVIIEDNGIGIKRSEAYSTKQEKHLHLGMEMTRKRLELLGKKFSIKTAIEFFETYPGTANPGTKVVLVMPVGI